MMFAAMSGSGSTTGMAGATIGKAPQSIPQGRNQARSCRTGEHTEGCEEAIGIMDNGAIPEFQIETPATTEALKTRIIRITMLASGLFLPQHQPNKHR